MAQAASKASTGKSASSDFAPRVLKQVSFPTFKLVAEKKSFLKFTGQIHAGNASATDKEGRPMKPAQVAHVTNLATGEIGQIVVPAVLERMLMDVYTEHSYVGKGFQIIKHAPTNGKRYSTFDVHEIAVD